MKHERKGEPKVEEEEEKIEFRHSLAHTHTPRQRERDQTHGEYGLVSVEISYSRIKFRLFVYI